MSAHRMVFAVMNKQRSAVLAGLERFGCDAPDGGAPACVVIAVLTFMSMSAFKAAAARHGDEIFGDIPRFTSISPTLQFNEPLG
jgi:hypothetical protein